ncbi:hypothetical protein G6O69_05165 [Pseudenhygromyxa sp. WMMC2535]|uniref:hypothetical protein n=1 Tax=Pseudenhygromyxa sp. WMMC2535 TaxID=2712867 RepID=UPI00155715EE|nr:hypothetical protein [Pseudenhygromyxa sp. WMMC2535]NVB37210.1 hypothetical protein [Pseudenhygromyxa sp. WMMC2535]
MSDEGENREASERREHAALARLGATLERSEDGAAVDLDLSELEFERDDGPAVAAWVDHLRAIAQTHGRLRVHACPQMLAHTLYKVGILRGGRITLVAVREEEPYG